PQITMGLTGALLGAMGRLEKLPRICQLRYHQIADQQELIPKLNALWQHWTGNLSEYIADSVATPLVMQPRSSLRLISQQEYVEFPKLHE
ncbi:MAG: hypothetical protein AB4058_21385, partial [Microcystaceae cyanobacterium]